MQGVVLNTDQEVIRVHLEDPKTDMLGDKNGVIIQVMLYCRFVEVGANNMKCV